MNKNDFIKKAKEKYGDFYDYSKVEYIDRETKVCIICPIHGVFWQTPRIHLRGKGCKKCTMGVISEDEFLSMSNEKFGDVYEYGKYVGFNKPIDVFCKKHNITFKKTPRHIINSKTPCSECRKEFLKNEFIKKFNELNYNDLQLLENFEYINNKTKIPIICKKHGIFYATPNNLLKGHLCPECKKETLSLPFSDFVEKSNRIHCNKYKYDISTYKNSTTKTKILCPIHGEFWQTPVTHLNGCGCKYCKMSIIELQIKSMLEKENIKFVYDKSKKWLNKQRLDFYLPDYNIAIECQGIEHFEPVNFFGGEKEFELIKKRDAEKNMLCANNGVKLLYYSNLKYDFFLNETIYHNLSGIIKAIYNADKEADED